VLNLAKSESGRYIQSPSNTFRIIKHRHWFIISPVHPMAIGSVEAENIVIEEKDKSVSFAGGDLQLAVGSSTSSEPQLAASPFTASLDAKSITFPLLLRKWKSGDYFYPLGMKKKKKLARFFIDQKLSRSDKENVWVLEMDKKIVWVVGMRIDDRYKVTDKTKQVLQITQHRNNQE
jgi:tRNA(Ile)-lysidine synthase